MLAKAAISRLDNVRHESGQSATPPQDLAATIIPLARRFANRKRPQLGSVSSVLALSRL